MAMAMGKEGALTQEFSFIQELIWSAPHRNPFPRCSDRIIWGLKADKSDRQQQADAVMLIDLRRALCNLLASLRASGHDEAHIVRLENELDSALERHVTSSWKGELHLASLDRELLVADIRECLHPITFQVADSDTSSVTLVDNTPGNAVVVKSEPPPPAQEEEAEREASTTAPSVSTTELEEADVLDVEMTMAARICYEDGGQAWWRLVFGLINHSGVKIDVTSLSYWPQDRASDVTTVKWPKGEMSLNEQPSFICYSVKKLSGDGPGPRDSPRLCFSWNYKKSSKPGKRSRMVESDEVCSCPMPTMVDSAEGTSSSARKRSKSRDLR